MKKAINITLVLVIGLLISACGNGSPASSKDETLETTTYLVDLGEAKQTVVLKHQGDSVKNIEQVIEFSLSTFGMNDGKALDAEQKETLEKEMTAQFDIYKDQAGLTMNTAFTDEDLIVTTKIDLDKADKTMVSTLLAGISEPTSLSSTVKELEEQGYSAKK